jgi:hypothetical protein
MDPLTTAVYQRLTSDQHIAAGVTSYQGSPAVFTDDRVPADAKFPYIVSSGNVAEEPWDTKTSTGRRPTRDIGVYVDHRQTSTVEALAWRVRVLFHRHRLEVDGWRTVIARVSGPIRLSADDYDARVLTVRFHLGPEDT